MTPLQTLERLAELQKVMNENPGQFGRAIKFRDEALTTDFAALAAYVERLEGALRFYADKENHIPRFETQECGCCTNMQASLMEGDRGQIAREALEQKP